MQVEEPSAEAAPEAKKLEMPAWDDEDEVTMAAAEGAHTMSAQELRDAKLEAEREQNRKRAERFGTDFVEPSKTKFFGVKRAAVNKGGGFAVGFDVTDEEEAKKRAARAARFGDMLDAPKAMDPTAIELNKEIAEENERRKARAEKYGTEFREVDGAAKAMFLEQRKEINMGMEDDDEDAAEEEIRPNAIHLYGVDSMSTREIMQYLENYAPSWVEWINDSSCNVVFEDEQSANRVLHIFSLPDEEGNKPQLDRQRFRDTVHFEKPNGDRVPLSMRIATEGDVRPARPNPNSMWARSLHRPNKFKRREAKGKKKKNNRRRSTGMDVGSKRTREDEGQEAAEGDTEGGMDVEAKLNASLDEVAAGGDRKKKRRRQSAPADAAMAKMFAKDLRNILSQPKATAANAEGGDDAVMTEDGAAAEEAAAPAEGAAPEAVDAEMAPSDAAEAV